MKKKIVKKTVNIAFATARQRHVSMMSHLPVLRWSIRQTIARRVNDNW